MSPHFFCPRWGSEHLDWPRFMSKVKEAGYDGIEWGIAHDTSHAELEKVWKEADRQGLLLIAQHYDSYQSDFGQHYRAYEAWLEKLQPYPVVKINSQTGKDFFSFQQNKALIELAAEYARKNNTRVLHETHRGKFSFAAHITRGYLEAIPDLTLTLDISHWVAVAESYLDDQQETVELAIARTGHLHARVGHTEGPQVTDPRAPEWQDALSRHLVWWDRVRMNWEGQGGRGEPLTITTEFGPHPYLVHLPYTGEPIASQWDINVYMMDLLKGKYGK